MTSFSVAAPMASSSNCRSSERMSRSPVIGSRASTSSPSTTPSRGNIPSSSPTRQTTRCGTDRIGTIVHTVSVPVRKFARVGRPARWRSSSALMSGSRISVSACGPAFASTSLNSRSTWADCQRSASGTAVNEVMPADRAVSHSRSGRAPESDSTQVCRRSMYSASRPASSMRLLPTSSSGNVVSSHACESSDIATPASTRSMPKRQVFWRKSTPYGCRWARSKPQRMLASRTQSAMASRSSSLKLKWLRTGPASARLRTSLAVARPPASVSSCDATPSSGLVCVSARSASLHAKLMCRMRAVHDVAEPETGDDQRRVGLDVRTHDEDVAWFEGLVVGEQTEQHFAQDVDLAGGAVAAVHLHRAVVCRASGPADERRWR